MFGVNGSVFALLLGLQSARCWVRGEGLGVFGLRWVELRDDVLRYAVLRYDGLRCDGLCCRLLLFGWMGCNVIRCLLLLLVKWR